MNWATLNTNALLTILLAGCSTPASPGAGADASTIDGAASPGPTIGDGGNAGSTTADSALTCAEVFDCAGKCATNDDACANGCLARAPAPTKDLVNAVIGCVQSSKCAGSDSACIQSACGPSLLACARDVRAAGTPTDGGLPAAGSVPTELVGEWFSAYEGWKIQADGSVIRSTHVSSTTCPTNGTELGTAVAHDGTLTVYLTSGSLVICGSPSSPYQPNQLDYTYVIGPEPVSPISPAGTKLTLTQTNNCTSFCATGYDKQ